MKLSWITCLEGIRQSEMQWRWANEAQDMNLSHQHCKRSMRPSVTESSLGLGNNGWPRDIGLKLIGDGVVK